MHAVRRTPASRHRITPRLMSPLSLAIATALCVGAAPVAAVESTSAPQDQPVERAIASAFRASDRAATWSETGAPLARPSRGTAAPASRSSDSGAARVVTASGDAAAMNGRFHLADGGRTDDLEVAAESWRADAEFKGDWGLKTIGAEYAYARGITGAGVRLGILDSGVDDRHSEFAGEGKLHLLDTRDGIDLPDDPYDREVGNFDGRPLIGYSGYSDHGTHVGGTMVANRDGNGMHGVAYGASLYSATHYLTSDAFTAIRLGQFDPSRAALQAFAQQGVGFVNHSWGSPVDYLPTDPEEKRRGAIYTDDAAGIVRVLEADGYTESDVWKAFQASVEAGTVHVFAAGNWGGGKSESTPHANAQSSLPLVFPDLERGWLSAVNIGRDSAPDGSSMLCGNARYWCVAAPGADISSAVIDRQLDDKYGAVRTAAMNDATPVDWESVSDELFSEVVPYFYGGILPVPGVYAEVVDKDVEVASLVDKLLTKAVAFSGKLHRLEIDEVPEDERDLVVLIRDNPFVLFEDLLLGSVSFTHTLIKAFGGSASDERVAEFQTALYGAIAGMRYETDGYGDKTGTSMAAPHVAGALGLIAERFGYLSNHQVRDVLLTTAGDAGAPVDIETGWGLISLKAAMEGPRAFLRDFDVTVPEGIDDTWSNDITNALVRTEREDDRGGLIKRGAGSLTLAGDNSFDGFTVHEGLLTLSGTNAYDDGYDGVVEGGALALSGTLAGNALRVQGGVAEVTADGRLDGADLFVGGADGAAVALVDGLQTGASTWVGDNGRLGGTGTLGDTTVAAGGTVAPGRSIGTLTVDGDYVQRAGSFFEVEMTPPDQVDRLDVTGTATLEGGTLVAQRGPGVYALGERYRFLTAAGGLTGTFDALDSSMVTPFLGLSLAYGADGVVLNVSRGASFASFAGTHNQRVAAGGLDALTDGNALVGSLVQLFPEDAIPAVDLLSGDVHATAQSVLIDTSRHLRGTALARAGGGTDPLASQHDPDRRFGAWVDIQRHGGRLRSDGNAAGTEYNGGNTLVGADYTFDNGLRLGVLGGIGESDLKARERQHARTDLDARYAGVYAGYAWRGLGLKAGWTYGQHDVEVERPVAYAGFEDRPTAAYDATTRQAFVEAGYRFGNATWGVEPYAQFAQVRASADAFAETGGAAALSGQTRDVRADLTTGGVRFDVNLKGSQQEETWVGLRGGVGYRKTGGELVPWTDVAFAGGDSFTVHGARVASDATLVELGVAARTSANSLLEVGYQGQYADEARDHGANLRWSVRF